jgi:undecaprenyl-diphosphatase
MLLTGAVAGGLAALAVLLLDALTPDDAGRMPVDLHLDLPVLSRDGFPSAVGLGAAIAVLTAVAPWVSRRARRWSWALVIGLLITRTVATPVSFDSPRAALIGWTFGALTLVLLGAPSRRPTVDAVVAGLRSVGLPVRELQAAGVDARGSTPYFGATDDGERLFVKALGDDERSADLLFRLYRRIEPRDFGDERPFSTLRRGVEHEALVALAAADLGVRTPRLRAFATAVPNGYVLAYEAIAGRSLDRLEPNELTDAVLGSIWGLVGQLRQHRIAHRDLRLANIFLDEDGGVWLIDFGFSELAASELLLANDVAELLASSSAYVGADRAIAHAAATVDAATLTSALDRLRPWALSGATRTALKAAPALLPELRTRLTERISLAS